MKNLSFITGILFFLMTLMLNAQTNVGVGTLSPQGKLHLVGSSDNSQLIIDANSTQSNTQPLVRLRNSDGTDLLWLHTDKISNCFLGNSAGKVNTTGSGNTFLGGSSGVDNTTGLYNSGIGYQALANNTTGSSNTATGGEALLTNTTGVHNCAVGAVSLRSNNGNYNIAMGYGSLYDNVLGSSNVGLGEYALNSNKGGSESVAIGYYAMAYANNDPDVFITNNVAVGSHALQGSFSPLQNIGINNTATGANAIRGNTSGNENTGTGSASLQFNTSGNNNTAQGYKALNVNTSGNSNTASGSNALEDNTTGNENAAHGYQALSANTTAFGNAAFGAQSLLSNTTGTYNTGLGKSTYFTSNNLSNTTAIGYFAGGVSNVSNRIEIGNASVSWIGGQMNWGTYSDGRIKDNVRQDVPGLDFINRLRPVTYNLNIHRQNEMVYKDKMEEIGEWDGKYAIEQLRISGFIAQEVEQAAKEINYDFSGVQKPPKTDELYSLRYAEFVMPLVKAVQELSQQNAALKANNEVQQQMIETMTMKLETLTAMCLENQMLIQKMSDQ